MFGMHLLKAPTGVWYFAGSIPGQLAFVSKTGEALTDDFIERQLRLPASYRSIKSRVFETVTDGLDAAVEIGIDAESIQVATT